MTSSHQSIDHPELELITAGVEHCDIVLNFGGDEYWTVRVFLVDLLEDGTPVGGSKLIPVEPINDKDHWRVPSKAKASDVRYSLRSVAISKIAQPDDDVDEKYDEEVDDWHPTWDEARGVILIDILRRMTGDNSPEQRDKIAARLALVRLMEVTEKAGRDVPSPEKQAEIVAREEAASKLNREAGYMADDAELAKHIAVFQTRTKARSPTDLKGRTVELERFLNLYGIHSRGARKLRWGRVVVTVVLIASIAVGIFGWIFG